MRKIVKKIRRTFEHKDNEAINYVWPKPLWQRVLRFPFDLLLAHVDLVRSALYCLARLRGKQRNCLFCADQAISLLAS